jgi:hypothetical protein
MQRLCRGYVEVMQRLCRGYVEVIYNHMDLKTVSRNIIKGSDDSKDNMDLSNYLINNFNNMFSRINWKYVTTYEMNNIIKSL